MPSFKDKIAHSPHVGRIRIVEDLCNFDSDAGRCSIVLESTIDDPQKAIEALQSGDATTLAMKFAAENGFTNCGISSFNPRTYPVASDGSVVDRPGVKVMKYRMELELEQSGF
jgi:hypothetical protein